MEYEIIDELHESLKHVEYVSLMRRVGASLLDAIVMGPITFAVTYYASGQKLNVLLILPSVVSLFYKVVLEKEFGQTLGKKIVGIAVVNEDLRKISLSQSFVRNYIYLVSLSLKILGYLLLLVNNTGSGVSMYYEIVNYLTYAVTLAFIFDCLMMSKNDRNQTIHDKWAKTVVVRESFLIK